ncbi:MAG: hypothetical protein ABIH11_07290 [Candidatus Altiarchaeota archaeon]
MKSTIIVVAFLLLSGCMDGGNQGDDDLRRYKGIAWAEIPQECRGERDDVCGLFECMVEQCWCSDYRVEGPVLVEGKSPVRTPGEAKQVVVDYVKAEKISYSDVRRAAELNDVFFNVFAYDKNGDEMVYTVAADGAIILTECGV